jgi:hypothetical protein
VTEWEQRASFYQEEVEKARQRAEHKDRKVTLRARWATL